MEAPMINHFLNKKHLPHEFQVTVFEQIRTSKYNKASLIKRLLQRECYWIYRLGTLTPNGLNNDIEFGCFWG